MIGEAAKRLGEYLGKRGKLAPPSRTMEGSRTSLLVAVWLLEYAKGRGFNQVKGVSEAAAGERTSARPAPPASDESAIDHRRDDDERVAVLRSALRPVREPDIDLPPDLDERP
jgi:hypothetical protein